MKRLSIAVSILTLLASTAAVASEPAALDATTQVTSVLVQVDAQGKITRAVPAYPLSSRFAQLLRTNLDEMIHTPARDKQGKPVASQFVMNLTLHTTPLADGGSSAQFVYVSTQPLPTGRWNWVHDADGHRLALVNADNRSWSPRPAFPPMPLALMDPPPPAPMLAATPATPHH